MQSTCARYQSRHRTVRMLAALSTALTVLFIADSVPAAASAAATFASNLHTDNSTATDTMQNLSTHILDTTRGKPATEVPVTLHYRTASQTWTKISTGITDGDGRFRSFFTDGQSALEKGVYKLHFDVGSYFRGRSVESLYPFIEIVFTVADPAQHYHIPLLLNPFGYSTYRAQLALLDPAEVLHDTLHPTLGPAGDDEPFLAQLLEDELALRIGHLHPCIVVVGDRTAHGDAPVKVHLSQHGCRDVSADVIEVTVYSFRGGFFQGGSKPVLSHLALMVASNPSFRSHSHFSSDPAMPTTRQPLIFAICPTTLPTAPAAPLTTTVSPSFGRQSSRKPKYAVLPGIPSTPTPSERGCRPNEGNRYGLLSPEFLSGLTMVCVRQPKLPNTYEPTGKLSLRLAVIFATCPPIISDPTG
uniref:hydroxyisourate hydrolase n=1 Tax=Anopheles minimus TaxID=112268 RepID=A0A182W5T7_9DIPT